jgi:hypothetical protein
MATDRAGVARRLLRGPALVCGVVAIAAASSQQSMGSAGRDATPSPTGTTRTSACRIFPADNYWKADISKLPASRRSGQWIAHMAPNDNLHPDFGPSYGAQPVPYGIPVTNVKAGHPRVRVAFQYASQSDKVGYPLGKDTRIEGGRGATGDRHAVVVDRSRCRLYETFDTRLQHGHWHAGSGATWDLSSDRLRPRGWTSADAAGLPILPGLLRYHEVEVTGKVTHAIRFTTDVTDRRHVWPARHDAGSVSNHAYPPMGARFRLRSSFSLAGYRQDTVAVLKAMKHYGLVLADNGSPWYFQGDADGRWPSGLLDELKTIPARAFVAVDTSSLQVSPDSAATRHP